MSEILGTARPISSASAAATRLGPVEWVICAVAALGFAFDLYEVLVLPLVLRPALASLGSLAPGDPAFDHWVGLLFYVPALIGGAFGLLGGYLTDRLGRRRVLVWSIGVYAVSAFAASQATTLPQLLVFRCTTIVGVSVEYPRGRRLAGGAVSQSEAAAIGARLHTSRSGAGRPDGDRRVLRGGHLW